MNLTNLPKQLEPLNKISRFEPKMDTPRNLETGMFCALSFLHTLH